MKVYIVIVYDAEIANPSAYSTLDKALTSADNWVKEFLEEGFAIECDETDISPTVFRLVKFTSDDEAVIDPRIIVFEEDIL